MVISEKSFDNTSLFTYKKKQAERLDEDNIKFLLNLDYNVKNYYLLLEYNKKDIIDLINTRIY